MLHSPAKMNGTSHAISLISAEELTTGNIHDRTSINGKAQDVRAAVSELIQH